MPHVDELICPAPSLGAQPASAVEAAPESAAPSHGWWAWLNRRPWIVLAVAVAIWGLTDVRSRGRIDPEHPGVHRTDFSVYTEAGAAFFDGRDPYAVTNPRGWGYLYPPLFAILVAPLHALPSQLQVLVWFALSVLMVWGCYRECSRLLRLVLARRERGFVPPAVPRWLVVAAIAAVTLPTLNCLQRGQVGVAKVYLLLLGLRLLLESRSWPKAFAAGAVFALAITLKVTPALPVGLLLFEQLVACSSLYRRGRPGATHGRRQRFAAGRFFATGLGTGLGLVACFLIVPASLVGWQRNTESLGRWWNLVAVKAGGAGYDTFAGNSYSLQNQSLQNSVRHLGNWINYAAGGGSDDRSVVPEGAPPHAMDAPRVNRLLLAARGAIVALAGLLSLWAAPRRDRLTTAAVFALACVATLIVAPIARTHYFVLALPAILFVPLWFERAGSKRLARVLAWTPAGLVLSHYCLHSWSARAGTLGIGITGWFVVSSAALWAVGRRQGRYPGGLEIKSFRVRAPRTRDTVVREISAHKRPLLDALAVEHGRAVGRLRLGAQVPDLIHHEGNG
jgi:hypothetical protein